MKLPAQVCFWWVVTTEYPSMKVDQQSVEFSVMYSNTDGWNGVTDMNIG
jgi:hypothetical protein